MSGDDRLVGVVDEAGQTLQLLMNVLLVLEDVGLTGQHGWAGIVIGGNVDDGQLASVGEDAMSLGAMRLRARRGTSWKPYIMVTRSKESSSNTVFSALPWA